MTVLFFKMDFLGTSIQNFVEGVKNQYNIAIIYLKNNLTQNLAMCGESEKLPRDKFKLQESVHRGK